MIDTAGLNYGEFHALLGATGTHLAASFVGQADGETSSDASNRGADQVEYV